MMMATMLATRNACHVSRVRREKLAGCMTCPLCHKLFRDAATISECLHTFCRKCIYEKITDDEVDCCPVCDKDLGCSPLEKLRADRSLQELRSNIFPSLRRNVVPADEVVLLASPPARRKERCLSSLEVGTPRVSSQTDLTEKIKNTAGKKVPSSQDFTFPTEELTKLVDYGPDNLSFPEPLTKFAQSRTQNITSTIESSKQLKPTKGTEVRDDVREGKADFSKSLNCLAEAAGRTESIMSNSQGSEGKPGPSSVHSDVAHVSKPKSRKRGRQKKVYDVENGSKPAISGSLKPEKSHKSQLKSAAAPEGLNKPAQDLSEGARTKYEIRASPIWFSLVTAGNHSMGNDFREGVAPLPQISKRFLRIKDDSIPVSYIKKYLAAKLNLQNEAEVEIKLQGHPLSPTMKLQHLVEWWLMQTKAKSQIQATVGSSAQDFVMVLSYGRNAHLQ